MGFEDQLWSHLVRECDADQIVRPERSRVGSDRRRGLWPASLRSTRWLLAPAIAGAAVLVVVVASGAHHANATWSQMVLRRAAAFVAPPADAHEIVHVRATITRTPLERRYEGLDKDVASINEEAWFVGGRASAARAILHPAGGDTYVSHGLLQFYDATRRLDIRPPAFPSSKPLRYQALAGHNAIRAQLPNGSSTTVRVTASELNGLRDGKDSVQEIISWNGHAVTHTAIIEPRRIKTTRPPTPPPNPTTTGFAAELHTLLNSGTAQVIRTTTQDGRRALQIYTPHPQGSAPVTYYVDPTTYAPIELDIHNSLSRLANTVVRFHTYQRLPLAGHRGLLRFTLPAGARITHAASAFFYTEGLPTLENSVN